MSTGGTELVTEDNDMYAKLIIPTQSQGATFSKSSVSTSVDRYSLSSGGGSVEEDRYEEYVSRLAVDSEKVSIGLLLSNSTNLPKRQAKKGASPDKTIHIPTTKITDARTEETQTGTYTVLAFETSDDLYQLKFSMSGMFQGGLEVDSEQIQRAVDTIQKHMSDTEFGSGTNDTDTSNTDSLTDELERLAELNEDGALSDEEFQAAKDELLDS
jgi:hypothetical protein